MTNECLICHKTFESKSALKQHTGTKYATLRRSHVCPDCDRPFCSEGSMETHRNAPSHQNMFSCGVCKKAFGSKHAVSQHEKSGAHERMAVIGKLASLTPVHANTSSDEVRLQSVSKYETALLSCLHRLQTSCTTIVHHTRATAQPTVPTSDFIAFDFTDYDSASDAAHRSDEGAWPSSRYDCRVRLNVMLDDEPDYMLCDGDCGWCGHCADGMML
jgi:hypothetical protein